MNKQYVNPGRGFIITLHDNQAHLRYFLEIRGSLLVTTLTIGDAYVYQTRELAELELRDIMGMFEVEGYVSSIPVRCIPLSSN